MSIAQDCLLNFPNKNDENIWCGGKQISKILTLKSANFCFCICLGFNNTGYAQLYTHI